MLIKNEPFYHSQDAHEHEGRGYCLHITCVHRWDTYLDNNIEMEQEYTKAHLHTYTERGGGGEDGWVTYSQIR